MADPTARPAGAVRAARRLVDEDDLRAAVAARRELGPEHEDALVERFVERIERGVEARVEQRLAEGGRAGDGKGERLALAIVSLALSIPLTAIVASELPTGLDLLGLLVVWAAIVAVNVAYGRPRR